MVAAPRGGTENAHFKLGAKFLSRNCQLVKSERRRQLTISPWLLLHSSNSQADAIGRRSGS